jgi:hypothetical protein
MRQTTLFKPNPLSLKIQHKEPRLLVRRLAIWDGKHAIVRNVPGLKPGLNIIWSEDTANSPGHDAGKTMFCRLLRYVLGDDIKSELRSAISDSLGDARVGAVIEVEGQAYSVVRSVAHGNRGATAAGSNLEQLGELEKLPAKDGLAEYLQRLDRLSPVPDLDDAWLVFLQSCTREQETRLSDIATWRMPARGNNQSRQDTLLRLLNLYSNAESQEFGAKNIQSEHNKIDTKSREYSILRVQLLRAKLSRALDIRIDGDDSPVHATAFRRAAKARLDTIEAGSNELRAAEETIRQLNGRLAEIAAAKAASEEAIRRIGGLTRVLSGQLLKVRETSQELQGARWKDGRGVCPTCGQTVDNLDGREQVRQDRGRREAACKQNIKELTGSRQEHEAELEEQKNLLNVQEREHAQSSSKLEQAQSNLEALRKRHVEQVTNAKIILAHAEEYTELVLGAKPDVVAAPVERTEPRILRARPDYPTEALVLQRRDRFRQLYDDVAHLVLGDEVDTEVVFGGNSITAELRRGGQTYSVLDVLIFDLVAMLMRAGGVAPGPAFLIHDSPRETDMGRNVYHGYVSAFQILEELGGPFFQSFVTTTSEPPKSLMSKVRLRLHGAPDEARLLGRAI